MNSLNEKYRLILENDQPESSGDEDLLAGIDASIDDSIKTGLIKIKDLPPEEVQDYLRRNNLQVTLPSNAQATDKEQAYIRILKQFVPFSTIILEQIPFLILKKSHLIIIPVFIQSQKVDFFSMLVMTKTPTPI
ncbi:hypothetical protein EBU71_14005, partial [bacterium]|nr:hypothetical protein [Candidatus Elulimicrobium humile]